tara:strand:- start:1170 stop:1340 length:171 start_codon:yes stop_codon:yes gene_type:complete
MADKVYQITVEGVVKHTFDVELDGKFEDAKKLACNKFKFIHGTDHAFVVQIEKKEP